MNHAIKVIQEILDSLPETANKAPQIGIHEFGDSSVNIGVRFWLPTRRFHELRYQTNNAIFAALKAAGIVIAFPQREVRLLGQNN